MVHSNTENAKPRVLQSQVHARLIHVPLKRNPTIIFQPWNSVHVLGQELIRSDFNLKVIFSLAIKEWAEPKRALTPVWGFNREALN